MAQQPADAAAAAAALLAAGAQEEEPQTILDGVRLNPDGPVELTFANLLRYVIGIPQPALNQITEQGIVSLEILDQLDSKAVVQLCKTVRGLPTRAELSIMQERNLLALHYWTRLRTGRAQTIHLEDYNNVDVIPKSRIAYRDHQEAIEKADAKPDRAPMPASIKKQSDWAAFSVGFEAHLEEQPGAGGEDQVLASVIRVKESYTSSELSEMTPAQRKICEVALEGPIYEKDSATVANKLHEATKGGFLETTAKPWIKKKKGREAYFAMKEVAEGDENLGRMRDQAKDDLDALYYSGEARRYTFGTHTSNMEECFMILEQYDRPMSEDDKVRKLLLSIRTTDPTLLAGIAHVRSNGELKNNYFNAKTYLAGCIKPLKSKDHRQVSFAGTNRKKLDFKKSYSHEEWRDLSQEDRDEIIRLRKEKKGKSQTDDKKKKAKAEKRKRQKAQKAHKRAVAAAKAEILKEQEDAKKASDSSDSDDDHDMTSRHKKKKGKRGQD